MSYNNWQPRPFNPVWKTLPDLLRVLDEYRQWYDQNLKDSEISFRIRQKFIFPHNPQSQFSRGKKR